MDRNDAVEVIVLRNEQRESKRNGLVRTVTFMLPNDGPHPFEGMVGDRLHIVAIKIGDDEMPAPVVVPELDENTKKEVAEWRQRGGTIEERPKRQRTLAEHVAMVCGEVSFAEFLRARASKIWDEIYPKLAPTKPLRDITGAVVRRVCEVESRAHIVPDTASGDRWNTLEAEYHEWQRRRAA